MTNKLNTPRSSASIYRKAARSIERGSDLYSCVAILNADGTGEMADAYVDTFAYGLEDDGGDWPTAEGRLQICGFKRAGYEGHDEDDLRVLALCFMAAMVEAGDA